MTVTNRQLIIPKEMAAALTAQYLAPANGRAAIDKFTATNTSGSTAFITVHIVAFGETPVSSNLIVDNREILENETYTFPELVGHMIEPNGFISTTGTASALTIACSGRELVS